MPLLYKNIREYSRESLLSRARYPRTSVLSACHEESPSERGPGELSVTLIWIAAQSGIRLKIYMTGPCGGPTAR